MLTTWHKIEVASFMLILIIRFVLVRLKVSLRWVYQQGVSLVVKSFNKERMKENLDIFDWELSAEELQKIEQIPQYRGSRAEVHVSEDGPYKSLEDLWDGEI